MLFYIDQENRLGDIVNHKDALGFVPLHYATSYWNDHNEIIKKILLHGGMTSIRTESESGDKPISSMKTEVRQSPITYHLMHIVKSNHNLMCLYEWYLNKELRNRDLVYFILMLLA